MHHKLSSLKRNTTKSSLALEIISEADDEEDLENNKSMTSLGGSHTTDPLDSLRAQFKLEIVKPMSQTLNAMLDQEQTKRLYAIRFRKAKKLRARRKSLLRN